MNNALTLLDHFNSLTPYAVGFDRVFNDLNRYVSHNTQSTNFPPYNIRKEGDYYYVIEMALAGFSKTDIEVEVTENTLSIKSKKDNNEAESTVYKGIANRNFSRMFTLADDIIVNSAKLENGMLNLNLERVVPEEKKPRLIPVK